MKALTRALALAVVLAAAGMASAAAAPQTIFSGAASEAWTPLSVAGGNFDKFARYERGALRVRVPEGSSWGKTGLRTPEPVLKPAGDKAATARFTLDAAASSAFVIIVTEKPGDDEWWIHDARFVWSVNPDTKKGEARLYFRQNEVGLLETGPEAPATVDFRIEPSGAFTATLPDGRFMETRFPEAAPGGYRIHALAHPREANKPADFALLKIETDDPPADPVRLYPWPDKRPEASLFNGRLGGLWTGHAASGGDFRKHVRFEKGVLVADIPEGAHYAKAGILSGEPLVWLDEFGEGAETEVVFSLDPARTDSFSLALANPGFGGVHGNDPGAPSAVFDWRRPKADKKTIAAFHLNPHREGDYVKTELPEAQKAPSEARFILRPGEITLKAEGMEPIVKPWDMAKEGYGFRIYAYAVVSDQNAPARMALRDIRILRKPGAPSADPKPAAGVPPLPLETVFEGEMNPLWEEAAVAGGDFKKFAKFDRGALVVDVPEKNGWAKTGLLSAQPLAVLDERVARAPTRLEFDFDPAKRQNVVIAFAGGKAAEMWPGHMSWHTFSYIPERDRWVMGLHHSPYNDWSREIDPAWMKAHWDGRLLIDLGEGWARLAVPGGPVMRANVPAGRSGYYATVISHAPKEYQAAAMTLRAIRRGMIAPEGMEMAERWRLLPPAEFDPEEYLSAVSARLPFPAAQEK